MRFFLLFLVFFLIGLAIILGDRYWNQPENIFKTTPAISTKFSLQNAPRDSLQGSVATLSGTVTWLSRTAAKPIKLSKGTMLQQGEEVSTGKDGRTVLRIANESSLLLSPNTHVSIIQLLPQNFVFIQDKGSVRYENTITVPVSVRSLDLITLITNGIVTLNVDQQKQTVSVSVQKGIVKEGYEDLQNTSNVVTINPGQTFIFDENTRTSLVQ